MKATRSGEFSPLKRSGRAAKDDTEDGRALLESESACNIEKG